MANLKSQGCGIRISDLASPEVWSDIGQVISISGPDGSASEINVTNLASSANEFIIGLPDEGSVSLEVVFDHASATAGHDTLHAARASQIQQHMQIFLSDSPETVVDFQCFVTTFSLSLGVDDKVAATFGMRITGSATIT